MLQDREVNIDEFIKITAGGIKIADFDQIQAAIVKRYQQVYGSDIDVSNTTADGVFINDLSLIINNVLQSFKVLYANLDVNTASGVYLDTLCRLSNVTRHTATASTAQLRISSNVDTQLLSGTLFVDYSGNEWVYNGNDIDIDGGASAITITVSCTTLGAIEAPKLSIYQTVEASYLNVLQNVAASVGNEDESDADLRARRAQSTGAQGTTVLESLVGALLDVDGIEDVQIINNNTDDTQVAADTTNIRAHNVYIIIRESSGFSVPTDKIGSIIHDKLTPGISSTQFTGNSANGISEEHTAILDENISWLNQKIYWKKAVPVTPTCSVTITPLTFYADSTTTAITNNVINYLNNIKLSSLPAKNDMIVAAMYADPKFKGASTYVVKDVSISATTNLNTYYNYTTGTPSVVGDDIVITFS